MQSEGPIRRTKHHLRRRGFAVEEVEKRIGLLAGLTGCFRDHRDSRLIEHTTFDNISLNGSRVYNRMC